MTLENLAAQGYQSVQCSMAAGITPKIREIRKEVIKESFADFVDIDHRMEKVGNVHGIEFINDSKATNANSTWFALESMTRPVIWIAGGVDTGNDYNILSNSIRRCVKAVIFLGNGNISLESVISLTRVPCLKTHSLEEAVELAYLAGSKGDTVLFSPAGASFDLFADYEDRGNSYKRFVKNL